MNWILLSPPPVERCTSNCASFNGASFTASQMDTSRPLLLSSFFPYCCLRLRSLPCSCGYSTDISWTQFFQFEFQFFQFNLTFFLPFNWDFENICGGEDLKERVCEESGPCREPFCGCMWCTSQPHHMGMRAGRRGLLWRYSHFRVHDPASPNKIL